MGWIKEVLQSLRGQWGAALSIAFLPLCVQGLLGVAEMAFFVFGIYRISYASWQESVLPLVGGAGLWMLWQMVWIPYRTASVRQYDRLLQGEKLLLKDSFLFFRNSRTWARVMGLGIWLGLRRCVPAMLMMGIPMTMLVLPWYLYTYYGWTVPEGLYGIVYGALILGWSALAMLYGAILEGQDFLGEVFFGRSKTIGIRGCTKRSVRKMRGHVGKLVRLRLMFSLRHSFSVLGFVLGTLLYAGVVQNTWGIVLTLVLCIGGAAFGGLTEPVFRCAMSHYASQVLAQAKANQMTMSFTLSTWEEWEGAEPDLPQDSEEREQSGTMVFTPRLFPAAKP